MAWLFYGHLFYGIDICGVSSSGGNLFYLTTWHFATNRDGIYIWRRIEAAIICHFTYGTFSSGVAGGINVNHLRHGPDWLENYVATIIHS